MRVSEFLLRNEVAHGTEGIEALRHSPGQALAFRLILQIACGHVERQRVALTEKYRQF